MSPSGIPSGNAANGLDSLHDDNPPHWLKSLQALTEMDTPCSSAPSPASLATPTTTTTTSNTPAAHAQHPHSTHFGSHIPLHRLGWGPYPPLPPGIPAGQFHAGPPPGFQTPAFRPPVQSQTELLQSAAMDRH